MKELYLLRGLPGSGKSTLAKSLGGKHSAAALSIQNATVPGQVGGYVGALTATLRRGLIVRTK